MTDNHSNTRLQKEISKYKLSTSLMFLTVVIAWSSTWLPVKLQLGVVTAEASVAYRFFLAGIIILFLRRLKGPLPSLNSKAHLYCALMGSFLFGINYMLIYSGSAYLTSGLVAVLFSAAAFFSILNARIFLGQPIELRVFLGTLIGLSGLTCIFLEEIIQFDLSSGKSIGLLLCLGSAFCASLGSLSAIRVAKHSPDSLTTTGIGMLYGAFLCALTNLFQNNPFSLDFSFIYLSSLSYLVLIGSVLSFLVYIALLQRIGLSRAGYITIAVPALALMFSSLFEGYIWHWQDILGLCSIIGGNLIILIKPKQAITNKNEPCAAH